MDQESENNRAAEDEIEECVFKYNFINKPWDERSDRSKVGIITLLFAIFVAIMALVVNNLVMHYRGFDAKFSHGTEIDCNLVKVDKYPYAARIHSAQSNELICIGAVVSPSSVLANELCIKSGPTRLRLGSPTNHKCKKGFSVDVVDLIPHDGVITKKLVLLSTLEDMRDCAATIKIGVKLDNKKQLAIIGRPYRGGRTLSYQLSRFSVVDFLSFDIPRVLDENKTICVQTVGKCPVRAGDLLIQKGRLMGLASTSVHRREKSNTVCFANLSVVYRELEALGVDVDVTPASVASNRRF